jgi:DNA-binding MarR family transcriptional regulator
MNVTKPVFPGRDYNLWILLNHTRHAIYRARELELSQYGITAEQARLLFVVQILRNRATPGEIAKHVFRASHTISSLVARTEKKGLVKKVKDLDSKKSVRIALTQTGQEALDQVLKMESIHQIMSGLSETKGKQLEANLKILLHRAIQMIGLDDGVDISSYQGNLIDINDH